ncbi:multiheme c-type cytochrome [Defluviimonas salinarum]|uniref:Multiheme c-type cytochrome n=1 Tax=Defluviimonas salinarum TaxID=2992147 RepID=A0ABT3J2W0_9RHOB|nr:multiheme c-type cytochrome [Defluviimonas salinarum]MCW3782010.1 multiheme c-type cytochrome [Defluviimonas salinarum]
MRLRFVAIVLTLLGLPAAAQVPPAYVGSDTCAGCHADETARWSGSHHALAWTEPSPETVIADFDGTSFAHDGMTARFRLGADGGYFVEVTEKEGSTTEYRVHSVAGIEPLQQYLLETEPGRLQSFDVVWDSEAHRWFHLYPDQDLPPGDGLHWTGPYKNWNARCAECHATGYRKNYDPAKRSYASFEAEIGVGCEACHGPGEAHLAWAAGKEIKGYSLDLDAVGFSKSFATTGSMIQQCATCHSRREALDDRSPYPGTPYHQSYNLSLLRPGLYYADGQSQDEVYVYGSFLQSKMYAKGVGCGDCHDPHTAELVAEGNAVCTRCHNPSGNPDFPSLEPADYDSAAHHFHAPGTTAAECKSCHMVERVYMGNDWRADHSFRVPRPDLAAETAAPDACTTCHQDQTAGWAAERIAAWYPMSNNRGPHFGNVLAHGRENPTAAAGDLADLAADESQPGIVRATALWLLENADAPEPVNRLATLLEDDDPLVRAAALGLQIKAPPQERVMRVIGLLGDPVRPVRIAAARAMLGSPIVRLPGQAQAALEAAMSEWQASLASRLDFPETHLQLAGMALTMRSVAGATAAFREAVRMDPQRSDAWIMLVRLAAATDGAEAAREVLDEALSAAPEDPGLLQLGRELAAD